VIFSKLSACFDRGSPAAHGGRGRPPRARSIPQRIRPITLIKVDLHTFSDADKIVNFA
jgi:hypothetical protein